MHRVAIGMTMLLLAGCGGGAGNRAAADNGAANRAPALDSVQQRIAAMNENERNVVMIQAIRGAHLDCQHVDSSEAVDNAGGAPSYVATCDRTKRYTVTIGPNGAGSVTAVQEGAR